MNTGHNLRVALPSSGHAVEIYENVQGTRVPVNEAKTRQCRTIYPVLLFVLTTANIVSIVLVNLSIFTNILPKTGRSDGQKNLSSPALMNLIDERIDTAWRSLIAASCEDADLRFALTRNETGGLFKLYPVGKNPIAMYSNTETDDGGWTVFQRRIDGSVDFFRDWDDYVQGFGNKLGDFWLGLEEIHKITSNGVYELRIDMRERGTGIHYYAKYNSFRLESRSDNYTLRVSGYSGNATDSLAAYHNNHQFSTYDRDNDGNVTENCASLWKGAWWYKSCYVSHLNGKFCGTGSEAMQWWKMRNQSARQLFLEYAEMKFRKFI